MSVRKKKAVEMITSHDCFGVPRGKCRCGYCDLFQREETVDERTETMYCVKVCSNCSCPSNRHLRLHFNKKVAVERMKSNPVRKGYLNFLAHTKRNTDKDEQTDNGEVIMKIELESPSFDEESLPQADSRNNESDLDISEKAIGNHRFHSNADDLVGGRDHLRHMTPAKSPHENPSVSWTVNNINNEKPDKKYKDVNTATDPPEKEQDDKELNEIAMRQKQREALRAKTKAKLEFWVNGTLACMRLSDYTKNLDYCDKMLQYLTNVGDLRKKIRLPILAQRAFCLVNIAKQKYEQNFAESLILLKRAQVDCSSIKVECCESFPPEFNMYHGYSYIVSAEIDVLYGNYKSAMNGFIKGKGLVQVKDASDAKLITLKNLEAGIELECKVPRYMQSYKACVTEYESKRPRSCLKNISSILKDSPYSAKFMVMKAKSLLLMNDIEGVLSTCALAQTVIESSDQNLCLRLAYLESMCLYEMGKLEEALRLMQQQKTELFTDAEVNKVSQIQKLMGFKAEGNQLYSSQKYVEAVQQYTDALLIDPSNKKFSAILLSNRAAAHMKLDDFENAIFDCDAALQRDPLYSKALLRRARARVCSGSLNHLVKAKEDFEKVQKQTNDDLSADLAQVDRLIKEFKEPKKRRSVRGIPKPTSDKTKLPKTRPNSSSQKAAERPTSSASRRSTDQQKTTKDKSNQNAKDDANQEKQSWKEKQEQNWRDWTRSKQRTRTNDSHSTKNNDSSSKKSSKPNGQSFSTAAPEWLQNGKTKDYYKILNLERLCDDRQKIKKSFHKLALQLHPDKNRKASQSAQDEASSKFKLVSEAYSVLGDDAKREQYQRFFKCTS